MKREYLEAKVLDILLNDMAILLEYREEQIRYDVAHATDDVLQEFLEEEI